MIITKKVVVCCLIVTSFFSVLYKDKFVDEKVHDIRKREREGKWAIYYTSPYTFYYLLANNFGDFGWILIGWLSVQTFQSQISIYIRGNFVIIIGDLH